MITFEWYIARAKIDLSIFFENRNITSDEQLKLYCKSKNIAPPEQKYFEDPEVEETVVEEPKPLVEEPALVEKKPTPRPKTTRKRTTRKKPPAKTETVEAKPKTTRKRSTRTRKK